MAKEIINETVIEDIDLDDYPEDEREQMADLKRRLDRTKAKEAARLKPTPMPIKVSGK